LGLLSQCMPEAFRPQLPELVTVLGMCLSHSVREVQLAALRASSLFIQVRGLLACEWLVWPCMCACFFCVCVCLCVECMHRRMCDPLRARNAACCPACLLPVHSGERAVSLCVACVAVHVCQLSELVACVALWAVSLCVAGVAVHVCLFFFLCVPMRRVYA
jgi:hypothetical protein